MRNLASNSGWPALVRRIGYLLLSWWKSDRIRASPAEGRLLRLKPPCVVFVDGEAFEVVERHVHEERGASVIVYSCQSATGCGRLIIRVREERQDFEIQWRKGEAMTASPEVDIEAFASS